MWVLTALLLLVPSTGQAATLEKPVLSLHPPWTTIFKGERVTLRCDGHYPLLLELRPINTLWYLGHLLLPSHKKSIEVQTPGVYRCQTRGAPVSDPIHLSVSNDWLILQVPYTAVFEGEPLIMRCRGWYDKVVYKLHYYRDGQAVRYFHSSTNYTVLQARASDSGRYQCSGTMRIPVESAPMFSAKVAVTVQGARPCQVARSRAGREPGWERRGRDSSSCYLADFAVEGALCPQHAFRLVYVLPRHAGASCSVGGPQIKAAPATALQEGSCSASSDLDRCPAPPFPGSTSQASSSCSFPSPKRGSKVQRSGCLFAGSSLDLASTSAPDSQAAALAPGNKPLSFRKPPVSRSISSDTSVPNATSAGLQFPAGGSAPTAEPPACAQSSPVGQWAGALKPDVDLLLREMQLLKGLLSRVVLELKEPQALAELRGTSETPSSHFAVSQGTPETTRVET
ncbi:Fc receptor-like B [Fukomys damarensis]|uniref:Fc receptor-like B n=1 Tax=Fukomys damarensis TaxID=885580 RepID=UPI001454F2A1|nr:Fc receptor-like B [Fukomys damarensis]